MYHIYYTFFGKMLITHSLRSWYKEMYLIVFYWVLQTCKYNFGADYILGKKLLQKKYI